MALFLVSVKQRANINGVMLEPGMSVQVVLSGLNSFNSDPLHFNEGREVINAFMRIYGIDVTAAVRNYGYYFRVERIG